MRSQNGKRALLRWVLILMALPVPALVYATITLPYTPQSGQVISAAGLNSNFAALNTGKTDSSNIHQVASADVAAPGAGTEATVSAQCPANSVVIGGGCSAQSEGQLLPRRARPDFPTQSYLCTYLNTTSSAAAGVIDAFAICLDQ